MRRSSCSSELMHSMMARLLQACNSWHLFFTCHYVAPSLYLQI